MKNACLLAILLLTSANAKADGNVECSATVNVRNQETNWTWQVAAKAEKVAVPLFAEPGSPIVSSTVLDDEKTGIRCRVRNTRDGNAPDVVPKAIAMTIDGFGNHRAFAIGEGRVYLVASADSGNLFVQFECVPKD